MISSYNQTDIFRVATIAQGDGTTMICKDDDLRRVTSFQESIHDVELPCNGTFLESSEGLIVTTFEDD